MSRDLDNFRLLVVLALATMGFATNVSYNAEDPPLEIQEIYDWVGFGEVMPGYIGVRLYWLQFAMYVASLGGMFFYLKFARPLMLVALFLNPLRTGLGGIWVSSPLEDAFWALHWIFVLLVTGMALFHPPVRAAFDGPRGT